MNIIQYIPSIDRKTGGTGFYIKTLAESLCQYAKIHIITQRSETPLNIEGAEIHYLNNNFIHYFQLKKEWNELLEDIKPDIVHINCCWQPECSLVQLWSQESGFKTVLTPHGMLEPWIINRHYWTRKFPALLLYQKKAIRQANIIHSTADSEKDNLLKLGYNNNIAVIPNAVNISEIQIKEDWTKKNQLLFLSRIHIKKGIEFLIESATFLKEELRNYKIIIAGEGEKEYIKTLTKKISENDLQDIIEIIGGVYGDEKWKLFRESDIFVLPTYSENFGIVVAEALASGTPVITTKGTPWQELEENNCGWWIDINTQSLTDAIKDYLLMDNEQLEMMGKNGRGLIESKYSSESIAKQFVEMYKNLTD